MAAMITVETLPKQFKDKLDDEQQELFVKLYNHSIEFTKDAHTSARLALSGIKFTKDGPTMSSVHTNSPNQEFSTGFIHKSEEKRYTLGIVYAPDEVDSQDDWSTAEEIEAGCWKYNRDLIDDGPDGKLGVQHSRWNPKDGDIVESYIAPADFTVDGKQIKKGTWLMGVIWSKDMWKQIKANKITGYSMGGKAKKNAN
jgi:hypothetical protein